tara:strand:- start:23 stop:355 length:333 start_codon:yes stop_codon:yes gene_type:complete
LCEWAEHQFKLNKPTESGTTEREHLEQVERQTGRKIEALEPPTEFPVVISHVWSAFITLSNSRSAGFSGPNPITYEQIKAWKELTETPLASWEVEAIKRLDVVYLGVANG